MDNMGEVEMHNANSPIPETSPTSCHGEFTPSSARIGEQSPDGCVTSTHNAALPHDVRSRKNKQVGTGLDVDGSVGAGRSPVRSERNSGASTDAFGDYLRRIGREELLTAEGEVDLARRIEVGLFAGEKIARGVADPALERELKCLVHEGQLAKRRFIEANLRLVVSVAKHYSGLGMPLMDLVQDGNLGLVRAVEKFDFMTGCKFSTYATWWIRQGIHRGMADKGRMIRIPVHTVEKVNKIKRTRRDLTSTLNREPTARELADATQMPVDAVLRFLRYDNEPTSLHASVGDGIELSDLIVDDDLPQPEEYAATRLQSADIRCCLDALPPRERAILLARFGLDGDGPQTLDQIAALQGVTRERVRQIEKRALLLLHVPRLEYYLGT